MKENSDSKNEVEQSKKKEYKYTYKTNDGETFSIDSKYVTLEFKDAPKAKKSFLIESLYSASVFGTAYVWIISKNDEAIRFIAKNSSDAHKICNLIYKRKEIIEKEKEAYKNSPAGIKEQIKITSSNIKVMVALLVGVAISVVLFSVGLSFADRNFTLCGIGLIMYILLNVIIGFLASKLGAIQKNIDNSYGNWTSDERGCISNGVSGCAGAGCIYAFSYFIYLFYGLVGWVFAIKCIFLYSQTKNSLEDKLSDNNKDK